MFRYVLVACLSVVLPASAMAAADGGPIYLTRDDIAAVTAKAASAVQPGHGTSSRPLMALGDYSAKVEYHVGPNIANAHPGHAELFQAIEGSGTLVTGGKILKTTTGAAISGGQTRHVAAGDVFIVPEGMPH